MLPENPTGKDYQTEPQAALKSMDNQIVAKELQAELKATLKKWKEENPAPVAEFEAAPDLPEPILVCLNKSFVILEVIEGEKAIMHVVENHSTRRIELDRKQIRRLLQGLMDTNKGMKAQRAWENLFAEERNKFTFAQAVWNRQFMAFKESVQRRLGIIGGGAE